jgi:hypothetical protein
VNEPQLSAKYVADKEMALSHLNLPNYHPSMVDAAYKAKFMNNELKPSEGNLIGGIHQNMFSLSNQYVKGIDLASLHESLNRAQTTLDESQSIRVKHLFSMTNNEKTFTENQNSSKSQTTNGSSNDRNNNKSSSSNKEKNEVASQHASQFKDFEVPAEKSSLHTNSKSGVSLKCAYCEAREDFKSR